jgi:hypothetical protein
MTNALADLFADGIAAAGADELSLPHIVITRDVPTGVLTYSGPYASAFEAMAAADAQRCRQTTQDPGWEVTFDIAPLCEPADEGHRPGCEPPGRCGAHGTPAPRVASSEDGEPLRRARP